MNLDPYEVLEIDPGASDEEIRRAWRELTLVWHPDRFESDSELRDKAEEKLKQINQAYQSLERGEGRRSKGWRASASSTEQNPRSSAHSSGRHVWRIRGSGKIVEADDVGKVLEWIRMGYLDRSDEIQAPGSSNWTRLGSTSPFAGQFSARWLPRVVRVGYLLLLIASIIFRKPALMVVALGLMLFATIASKR